MLLACVLMLLGLSSSGLAQEISIGDQAMQEHIRTLTDTMNRVEAQLQATQRELNEIRQELVSLQNSARTAIEPGPTQLEGVSQLAEAVKNIRDTQTIHDTQIATLEQSKAESVSKYPVKLSGMILMTGFVNSQQVDVAATPAVALGGSGSTGATLQQTVLGLDVTGPHLFGARSHADMRFDLNGGTPGSVNYGGYKVALLRFRTAHAELNWNRTRVFFALDRAILNPEVPASLTAVALPPLAWSGNLWSWNPQLGISRDVLPVRSGAFRVQAALTDVADPPPLFVSTQNGTYTQPTTGELSRWPGVEWRLAYEGTDEGSGLRLGVSGFFASHRTATSQTQFDSWAGAADFRIPVMRFSQISGNIYRGAALGVLGGGAYKDYVLQNRANETYFRTLDDSGGWVQWKQKAGQKLEFNEAFGIDDVPAYQLLPYAISTPASYYNLTRNRTFTGNVIYSPSAYVLFSLEYRRIASSYVTSPTMSSDVIGIGAGYQF